MSTTIVVGKVLCDFRNPVQYPVMKLLSITPFEHEGKGVNYFILYRFLFQSIFNDPNDKCAVKKLTQEVIGILSNLSCTHSRPNSSDKVNVD